MNGLPALVSAVETLKQQRRTAVMATIIATEGSSYRKAGARMLLHADGNMTGILGGGCFEGDLMEQSRSVFDDGRPLTVRYDMRSRDEAIWGLGLGCNGAVDIFVQRLDAAGGYQPMCLIAELLDQGGTLMTVVESAHPDIDIGYSWTHPERQPVALNETSWQPGVQHIDTDSGPVRVHVDPIRPPAHLLICGAGPDAVPLSNMALMLGWRVTIADHRPAYIEPGRFHPQVTMSLFDGELEPSCGTADAIVVMSHNFAVDARYLSQLADSASAYLGVLGPPQRRQALLDEVGPAADDLRDQLHGPVGLDLGGELPEEIALSILAEIQATLNTRTPLQLSGPRLG